MTPLYRILMPHPRRSRMPGHLEALAGIGDLGAIDLQGRSPTRLALLGALPRKRGRGKNHAAAVVTPPSTTMVWPVMKLEASEPR